ncbi:hypothetical protein DFJ74DRAFT_665558 [Hyaloraphidium curvatum]|nr:hypothetical protein DFJ74DRAFT_665558 [Hyaloraphidium curvatum]
MDARSCNEHLATLLPSDPTVALLLQRISSSRPHVLAKPGIVCTPCRGTTSEGARGYYDPNARRIILCCDELRMRSELRETLVHELVHAWDQGRDYSTGVYPGEAEREELLLEEAGVPRQRGGLKAVFDGVVPKEAEDFARKWYRYTSDLVKEKLGSGSQNETPEDAPAPTPGETDVKKAATPAQPQPFPTTFTAAFLCSEIRASALGQCAPPLISWFRRSCARKAAEDSARKHLGMVQPGRAETEVNRIFDICFKDTAPVRSS